MGFEQIASLPVADIAARDAVMFIWGTHPKLADVLALIPRWGFVYKSIAFMWVKTRGSYSDGSGKPFFGLGRWTRGNTEPCYLAVRGKPSRISAGVSQIVLGVDDIVVAPVGRHSAKPPEVRQKIVDLMGPLRRIELFARERVPGWDCWGNEVESDVVLFPRLQHALKGETK
jgi:N6-adenosine-specific RNA methylase IME4